MIGATLCSGIGAPELAARWIDWRWSAETDPFASAVHAARFPGSTNLGDMTAPDLVERMASALPDIIVAGTPCQSFSVAGLRRGLEDPRGNLTVALVGVCDAIDDLRHAADRPPVWIVWENVPGILSDRNNAFGSLLGALVGDDAAIDRPRGGWTHAGVVAGPRRCAAWRILDAQHFGLAQRRKRVFVVALGGPGAWACADALLPITDSMRWHPAPRREAGQGVAGALTASLGRRCGVPDGGDTEEQLIPLRANGASTANGAGIGAPGDPMLTLDTDGSAAVAYGGNNTAGPIDVAPAVNAHGGTHGRLDFASEALIAYRTSGNCGAWVTGDRTDALTTATDPNAHVIATPMMVRRLMPVECERLQGFPDGFTDIAYRGKRAADGPRYRTIGNSMAAPVIRHVLRQVSEQAWRLTAKEVA